MKNLSYLLAIAVVALGLYAYDANRDNKQLQQTLHARYTNEFTNASEKLSLLHTTISQSLLFKDEQALNGELDSIWRMSSDLRSTVSNLPLHEEVTTQWMRYLGKIGDTAKATATSGDVSTWRKQMTGVTNNLHAFTEEWQVATANFYANDNDFTKWSNSFSTDISSSPLKTVMRFSHLHSYRKNMSTMTLPLSSREEISRCMRMDPVSRPFLTLNRFSAEVRLCSTRALQMHPLTKFL